jgi:guanylate kinase
MLMQRFPKLFAFGISHTSRPPRIGEVDGVGYHFVDKQVIEAMITNEDFVEHSTIHTNIYGLSFKAVEKVRSEGKICILDSDMKTVITIKSSSLDCRYIFIAPSSLDVLEARYRGRAADSEEKILSKIEEAKSDVEFGRAHGNFDAFVINEDLETAFRQIVIFLCRWFPDHEFERVR